MPKLFTGRHAVLLGTTLVEPGAEIPQDADSDEVQRLTDEGQVADVTESKPAAKKEAPDA